DRITGPSSPVWSLRVDLGGGTLVGVAYRVHVEILPPRLYPATLHLEHSHDRKSHRLAVHGQIVGPLVHHDSSRSNLMANLQPPGWHCFETRDELPYRLLADDGVERHRLVYAVVAEAFDDEVGVTPLPRLDEPADQSIVALGVIGHETSSRRVAKASRSLR